MAQFKIAIIGWNNYLNQNERNRTMTKLAMTRDINGYNTFGLSFSTQKVFTTLATTVEQTTTVPTQNVKGYLAIFSYEPGAKVWVGNGSSAVSLPSGSFAASNGELNPSAREVSPGSTLRFITNDTTAEIGVSYYELQ